MRATLSPNTWARQLYRYVHPPDPPETQRNIRHVATGISIVPFQDRLIIVVAGTYRRFRRSPPMPSRIKNIDQKAIALIDLHGRNARQKVVDEIVRAVRDHDVRTAKHWEKVGETIDALLAEDVGDR